MRWQEIAAADWNIPGTRTKNSRSRTVPLPQQAIAMLKAIRGRNAEERTRGHCANSQTSETRAVDLVFCARGTAPLSNWDRHTKRVQRASNTSAWHRHDLRRTVATMLGDLGFAPHVVSVVLGHAHVAEGATAVYARSRYQREHQEALQVLADEIDRITNGGSNVGRLAVS